MLQAWGMTETSPIATVSSRALAPRRLDRGRARRRPGPAGLARRRWSTCGSSTRTPASAQPWDDKATGEIQAAGPWIAKEYYRGEGGGAQFTEDGWLRTGDVASVDRYGSFRLVDRTKDLIKSGGEWIGSVELENEIMAHPKVAEAAVIAIPHEKWVERPLACVVVKPGETLTAEEILEFLDARGWRSGGCPTPSSSSTRCRRRASASSRRRRCARSSAATRWRRRTPDPTRR